MRVALLGTGKMGAAVARRLAAAGHQLVLWNRTPERASAVGVGSVVAMPAQAVFGAELVLSLLTGPEAVREVYGQVTPEAHGQVFVEMSTAGPAVLEEIAPGLAGRGSPLLAGPVLGSVPAVDAGQTVILVGGDAAAFAVARPTLEALGEPRHVGDRAAAAGLKLVNNTMLAITNAAAAELLAAAGRAGLDREMAFGLLERAIPYLGARRGGLLGGPQPANFFLRDMVKDLDLGLAMYHAGGASTPLVAAVRELYAEVAEEHGLEDMAAVTRRYRP